MLAVLFVGGFFRSLQFTCINAISYAEVDQSEMSQATSFTSVFQQIALSFGITMGALVLQLSLAIRHSDILKASDFPPAFLLVGFVSLMSFVSFARLPKDAGEEVAGRKRVASAAVAVANGHKALAWVGGEGKSGLIDGNPHQVLVQLYGITVTVVYDVVVSLILLKLVDLTVGLRVGAEVEREGLDLALHGEAVQ